MKTAHWIPLALPLAFSLGLVLPTAQDAAPPSPAAAAEKAPATAASADPELEELIQRALSASPRIAVAESEVAAAIAGLRMARVEVAREITELHFDTMAIKKRLPPLLDRVNEARDRLQSHIKKGHAPSHGGAEGVRIDEQLNEVLTMRSELGRKEAQLRLLTEVPAQGARLQGVLRGADLLVEQAVVEGRPLTAVVEETREEPIEEEMIREQAAEEAVRAQQLSRLSRLFGERAIAEDASWTGTPQKLLSKMLGERKRLVASPNSVAREVLAAEGNKVIASGLTPEAFLALVADKCQVAFIFRDYGLLVIHQSERPFFPTEEVFPYQP